ncbi:MAG: hypothetical protein R3307_06495, partial [Anaerolineales bacterium]|nr:hypothetical protein [Anaerolineales bacterium]
SDQHVQNLVIVKISHHNRVGTTQAITAITRKNRKINFIECDLLPQASIETRNFEIDVMCANLPYIPTKTLQGLSIFGREPTLALDGGDDGFELIRRLMRIAPDQLAPNSLMLFEIEESLGREAVALARQIYPSGMIELYKDLAGRDRLLEIQLP